MGILSPQLLAKARERLDFDLPSAIANLDRRRPVELNTPDELDQRKRFLLRSLGSTSEATQLFERVIAGNELQPVNYLERGTLASRAVARIDMRRADGRRYGYGSGFLIAPGVLLTNNHVLPSVELTIQSVAQFNYQADLQDRPAPVAEYGLNPQQLFWTSKELDCTVVAVRERGGDRPLRDFGCLPLLADAGKSAEGEWLTIVQHPQGQPKQLCVRENRLIKRAADVLWYTSDTLGGSSGSPVFNNDWYVVALHHSGVPEMEDGKIRGTDGQLYNPTEPVPEELVKWVANEGIRASRIVQTLRAALPAHPLLQPLFAATPESARVGGSAIETTPPTPIAVSSPIRAQSPVSIPMSDTSTNSAQTFTVPIQLTITLDGGRLTAAPIAAPTAESVMAADEAARRPSARPPAFDVPFVSDYHDRRGYNPKFLGDKEKIVPLPKLSPALQAAASKLLGTNNETELKYHNFSVVMHAKRRFAIFSAANLDFSQRYDMSRPKDTWRLDHRIDLEHQVGEFLYAANQFDRGHLTRREDLEYGPTPLKALQSAADTCHFTNCSPQHARFNQNKEIWQGIERHVLESAIIANQFKAQIFTGPVFSEGDPSYRGVKYPLAYWKVVAAINASGKLFATAYLASQQEVIDQYGIEAAPEVPFGPYTHFQVRIAEIERLTGLIFIAGSDGHSLSRHDPLAAEPGTEEGSGGRVRSRRRSGRGSLTRGGARPNESASSSEIVHGYHELLSLDDIVAD